MNWQSVLEAATSKTAALAGTFGLGGGVGIVKFLKHMPAPYQDSPWTGAVFDWLQDLVSNQRIGERRTRAGEDVPPVPKPEPIPEPKAAPIVTLEPEVPLKKDDARNV